jgi:hypothetical protein
MCNVRYRVTSRHRATGNITPAITNVLKVELAESAGQRISGSVRRVAI